MFRAPSFVFFVFFVFFCLERVRSRSVQMKPLNECLLKLIRRRAEDPAAPRWVMFHDMDEYIYPEDTSLTMVDALRGYGERCCVQVIGPSGLDERFVLEPRFGFKQS